MLKPSVAKIIIGFKKYASSVVFTGWIEMPQDLFRKVKGSLASEETLVIRTKIPIF